MELLIQELEVVVEGSGVDRALADLEVLGSRVVVDVVEAHLVLERETSDRGVRLLPRVVPTSRHQFVAL